jgi:hypothetical protein
MCGRRLDRSGSEQIAPARNSSGQQISPTFPAHGVSPHVTTAL